MVKAVNGTSEKAQSAIMVTELGMTKVVKDVPRKLHQPIDCNEFGSVRDVKAESQSNA
jgi:hypothetical protein